MRRELRGKRPRAPFADGFTLVEMVSVISIMGIVGLVAAFTVMQSMKVYARSVPAMDAAYQTHLAAQRMTRELHDLLDTDSITTSTSSALTFDDSASNTIAYSLSGSDLLRNGDLLASGVTALAFEYWASDGTAAATAADIHLIEIDLTVQVVDQPHRIQTAVFPRILSPVSGGGGGISASPIAHWKLDETSGTTVVDSVAANDGTLVNGVTLGDPGAPAGATCATFDGIDDYVEIPHSASYLLDNGSIQMWIRPDDTSGDQAFFSKDSTGYDTGGHVNLKLVGDDVQVRLQSTTVSYTVTAANTIVAGNWHHVAFTFGDDGMKLYVDGVLRDTDAYTGGLGSTSGGAGNSEPLALGASSWGSGDLVITPLTHYYDGRLDAVAIYGVALPAADIATLHAAGGAID